MSATTAEEGLPMDIGIGIPNSVPTTTGHQLLQWGRRAEQAGFSSLGTIGAVEYPNFEELTTLATLGAVTERIKLLTNVLIAPPRSAVELAKHAATVDQLTGGGRLTLGLGVGWRRSDFALTGRDFTTRGRDFDVMLADLHTAWRGEALLPDTRPVSPPPVGDVGVPILVGGTSDAAIRRVAEFGVGWTAGNMPVDKAAALAARVRAAWDDAERDGAPRLVVLRYFSLGATEARSREALLDYYAPRGPDVARALADSALRDPAAITDTVEAFAEAGFDEMLLYGTVPDPEQVELLADIVR